MKEVKNFNVEVGAKDLASARFHYTDGGWFI